MNQASGRIAVFLASKIAAVCVCLSLLSCSTGGSQEPSAGTPDSAIALQQSPDATAEGGNPAWMNNLPAETRTSAAQSNSSTVQPTTPPSRVSPSPDVPTTLTHVPKISYSSADNVGGPYVAMTFDDGPHKTNTPRLLDMLKARGIRATFYVVGQNVDLYPEIVARMVAEGHEVANHTWTHGWLTKMSDSAIRSQLSRTEKAIMKSGGPKPRTLRPPYGAISSRQKKWIHDEFGYKIIMWSLDPQDWKRPGTSVVTRRIVTGARSGSIILAHDIHKPTIDAMPATLDQLKAKGFKFVTVSQLVAMDRDPVPATAQR